jgi:site-specific DNA recombinase
MILEGLKQRLMEPKLVEEFVRAFQREVNSQRREQDLLVVATKRELAEVTRKLNGLIDAIAEGLRTPGLQKRLEELESRRAELEQEITSASAPPIRLHPSLAQVYRRKVEQLQQALNDPEIRDEAIEVLRSLLESVVIAPADGGLEIEIVGEISHMIEIGMEDGKRKGPVLNESTGRSVKVVAGARNQRYLHLDYAVL